MHVLKQSGKQSLTQHGYCSQSNDMFGLAWVDVMIHLLSLADRRPKKQC